LLYLLAGGDGGDSWGYATAPVQLDAGQTTMVNLSLAPIATTILSGQVLVPEPYSISGRAAYVRFPEVHALATLVSGPPGSSTFSYTVPNLTTTASLCAQAMAAPGPLVSPQCGSFPPTANLAFSLVAAPQLTEPVDGSPLTTTGSLFWTPFAGGVHCEQLRTAPPGYEGSSRRLSCLRSLSEFISI
jgi:hypothetical protein